MPYMHFTNLNIEQHFDRMSGMFHNLLLSLSFICVLSSCVSFNTGAKLDSIGKAVPTLAGLSSYNGQQYQLNGAAYKEVMVEYKQPNPHLIGTAFMGYFDNSGPNLPATDDTGAPQPELYLARLNPNRTDVPSFIRAVNFPYAKAERMERNHASLPETYFKRQDWLTLTRSQIDTDSELSELPTIRTTGNRMRLPLSILLSYGVDMPLTAVGYTVGSLLQLPMLLFGR